MSRTNQTYSEKTQTLPSLQTVAQVNLDNKVLPAAQLLFMVLLMAFFLLSVTACSTETESGAGADITQQASSNDIPEDETDLVETPLPTPVVINAEVLPASEEPPASEAPPASEEPPVSEEPPASAEPPASEEPPASAELAASEELPVSEQLTVSEELPASEELTAPGELPALEALPVLKVTDYVVVSTRRTGRTTTEYTLKIKATNSSSKTYDNVLVTLVSAPAHITVIDGIVNFTEVPPSSTTLSPDTFIVDVDLALSTSFDDLVWNFEGDVVAPPPPPPKGSPTQVGYFMNIDNNLIPGDSLSSSHRDWIELSAFTEGMRRDDTGTTGSTRSRTSFVFDGVTVSKLLDRSSPKLREALAQGRFFGEVKIDIIASCGGNLYTVYANTLSTAQIVVLTLTGSEETPTENIGLIYTRIETMYTPVADDCTLLTPVYSTQDGELLSL